MLQTLAPLSEPSVTGLLLRFLLCSAYVWSGVTKLVAFNATARHFSTRFQLPAPRSAVALTIAVQLIGSAMFVTGWMAPAAAVALALFTMAATVVVYPFWKLSGVERARNIETFLEHVGLAAAFLILAWPLAS
ncbi:MAG: DoxX family protein [Xanthobacteraceae bacterium]|nr:DoxX family protein [Xanthobacteraceae bacterium]